MKIIPNPEFETAPYEDWYCRDKEGKNGYFTKEQIESLTRMGFIHRYKLVDGKFVEVPGFIQV